MQYILISYDGGECYQCIRNGELVGYRNIEGLPILLTGGSAISNASPDAPAWDSPDEVPVPVILPVETPSRIITKVAYMNLFTDSELAKIYSAAKTVVQLEVWLERFKMSDTIDLNNPHVQEGLRALESFGLLAQGRAFQIIGK